MQPASRQISVLSLLQFAFSAIVLLIALPLALSLILMALGQFVLPPVPGMQVDTVGMLVLAAGAGFVSLMMLPSAWFSLQNLLGHKARALSPQPVPRPAWMWLIPLALVVLAGYGVSRFGGAWDYLLPLLHVAAVGLTGGFLFALASRGLSIGSRQRFWGVLGSGLVLGPFLILLAELFFLLLFGVAAVIALSANPDLLEQLLLAVENIPDSPEAAESLLSLLEPYLANPLVLYAILAFAAGIVPLVEEALKPIGVWLLFNRELTPMGGFVGGLLSGAAYGIFESISLSGTGETWVAVIVTRAGTSLLHIVTAGLVGWGLALAFKRARFFNLVLAYLAAVLVHGLWNGLTLVSTLTQFDFLDLPANHPVLIFSRLAPFALLALFFAITLLMLALNLRFRRRLPASGVREYNESSVPPGAAPPVQQYKDFDNREAHGTDQPAD